MAINYVEYCRALFSILPPWKGIKLKDNTMCTFQNFVCKASSSSSRGILPLSLVDSVLPIFFPLCSPRPALRIVNRRYHPALHIVNVPVSPPYCIQTIPRGHNIDSLSLALVYSLISGIQRQTHLDTMSCAVTWKGTHKHYIHCTLYKNTYANPTLYFNNQAGYSRLANNANKAKTLQQSTTQDCKLVTHFLLDRDQTTMIETKIKTFAEDLHDLQLKWYIKLVSAWNKSNWMS